MVKQVLCSLLIIFVFHFSFISSYVTSNLLERDITSCTFDQSYGIFYATTEQTVGEPGIITASTLTGAESPTLGGFNTNTIGRGFKNIIMVCNKTNTMPSTVAAITHSENGLFNRFVVTHATAYTMSNVVEDFASNDNTYGVEAQPTAYVYPDSVNDSEILGITACTNVLFSVTHRIHNNFLAPGSVLTAHKITVTSTDITIDPTAFQKRLDSRDFLVGTGVSQIANISDAVSICYNDNLKTVYCAPTWIKSGIGNTTDGIRSVAAYRFNEEDYSLSSLSLHATANENSENNWYDGLAVSTQSIVGVVGNEKLLSVHQLAVMHTSTDKYYLIIFGGHGRLYQTGDQVYSLPLVGPDNLYTGSLANVSDATCSTRAENAQQLYTAASIPAQVGGGTLPWEVTNYLNHMVVIKDTVYVSVHNPSANRAGIYYSQAQFNNQGNIIRWTQWKLAAPRTLGATDEDKQGAVKTFAVNIVSGKVWAIPSDQLDRVRVPSWIQVTRKREVRMTRVPGGTPLSPHEALLATLSDISITAGWYIKDQEDYSIPMSAYIGKGSRGQYQLVITRNGPDDIEVNAQNFKIIDLPSDDAVLSVGFLQSPIATDSPTGILLIGTQTRLYAYLNNTTKCGGYVNNVGDYNILADTHDLSAGYWVTSRWYSVLPDVFDSNIASIDALYNDLYILERAKNVSQNDFLHKISISDIAANTLLEATPLVICSSNYSSKNFPYILNHVVMPSQDDPTTEHVIIGTYNGAFALTRPGGIQSTTTVEQVSMTPIEETRNQKIIVLSRTSNSEARVTAQNSLNKFEDKVLYVSPLSTGEVSSALLSTTPIVSSTNIIPGAQTNTLFPSIASSGTGQINWTDGARKFTILANNLVSQEGDIAEKKISKTEAEAFKGKRLQSIDIVGGIITVQTQDDALYLK